MNMTKRNETKSTRHLRPITRLLFCGSLLWAFPAAAEECSSPCTITRAGLPTLRLENTVSGIQDWDLETSAFGVELALESNAANTGAFRVEHFADPNTLVIDDQGGVGIGTSAPVLGMELQINDHLPQIRLDDISFGDGRVDLLMSDDTFSLLGNESQRIIAIDTRATDALQIVESGRVRIGRRTFQPPPEATLHVFGDAIVEGDVTLGSSRSLKTSFGAVSSNEILARLTELPVVSWRYKTEPEGARHIGPFAEDFQRIFGLGDGETLSIVDAQGVAFAALQGLAASQAALEQAQAALEMELAERDARIAGLVARLETLERRDGRMPSDPSGVGGR